MGAEDTVHVRQEDEVLSVSSLCPETDAHFPEKIQNKKVNSQF